MQSPDKNPIYVIFKLMNCRIIKHHRIIKHRQRSRDFINSYNSLNITLNDINIYVGIEYMHIRITREY